MTAPMPARSERNLRPADRQRLADADRRLREAVKAYEPFLGRELDRDGDPVAHDYHQVARAQAEIEEAERELWRLREKLLDWPRPSWAPPATLVADWFSDEDRVYDEATPPER